MSSIDDSRLYETKEVDGKIKVFLNTIVEALQGTFTPSGLQVEGRVTRITINDSTWTKLERSTATTPQGVGALTERNAISIQNNSIKKIKLNYVETQTISTGYLGMELKPGAERSYDIKDSIAIYAMVEPGQGSIDIEFEELA